VKVANQCAPIIKQENGSRVIQVFFEHDWSVRKYFAELAGWIRNEGIVESHLIS
jgi:hypothetical protein